MGISEWFLYQYRQRRPYRFDTDIIGLILCWVPQKSGPNTISPIYIGIQPIFETM